jgi:hypothetical protein
MGGRQRKLNAELAFAHGVSVRSYEVQAANPALVPIRGGAETLAGR